MKQSSVLPVSHAHGLTQSVTWTAAVKTAPTRCTHLKTGQLEIQQEVLIKPATLTEHAAVSTLDTWWDQRQQLSSLRRSSLRTTVRGWMWILFPAAPALERRAEQMVSQTWVPRFPLGLFIFLKMYLEALESF